MGQIKYFPLKSIKKMPDKEEMDRREFLQAEIASYRWKRLGEAKTMYEHTIISQQLANFFTKLIKLVK